MGRGLFVVIPLIAIDIILYFWLLLNGHTVAIFQPKGMVAGAERTLIITAVCLMLVIVIPVFILTAYIAWKFRDSNPKAVYAPEAVHKTSTEIILWILPTVIVIILSVLAWQYTHMLDPYKPIRSAVKPLTIQVVALRWKWLFLYPAHGIATVNFIQIPVQTPVHFVLTADAPMNSFWIPQLGGQMYAMPGMETQLNLIADTAGSYSGSAVEINGRGFSGMRFTVYAVRQDQFDNWAQSVKTSSKLLDMAAYNRLAVPSEDNPQTTYSSVENGLYNEIMNTFLVPSPSSPMEGKYMRANVY